MMSGQIRDPDVRLLAAIAGTIEVDYPTALDAWEGSPFTWILRARSSRKRGKIGEQLVAGWCAAKGLDVRSAGDSEADRVIAGHRVEIKFSTLWESGVYKFQQIRDQRYDDVFCLGIGPFDAHAWVVLKSVLTLHVIGHRPQHGGRRGKDTFWLSFAPKRPPAWLAPYGGSLGQAFEVIKRWRV